MSLICASTLLLVGSSIGHATSAAAPCALYPIALGADALANEGSDAGRQAGPILNEVNFDWLTWTGAVDSRTLAQSLTPPGNSNRYVNPLDPTDHLVSVGDLVRGVPGERTDAAVRAAMRALLGTNIVVPVRSSARGRGANVLYRVAGFAEIRLLSADLSRSDRELSFRLLGRPACLPNRPPIAHDVNASTNEDTATTIHLDASDPDGDPLTYSIVSAPAHGTLSGTGATQTYAPNPHFYGTDSFTYKANDGIADSNIATVSITVNHVNHAPVAQALTITTNEDTAVPITLNASDPDGDPLTYAIVTQPAHGTLTGVGPAPTYTPAPHYYGADSFTYKANDGLLDSNVATVSITVNHVNHAPVAVDDTYSTGQDTTLIVVTADGVLKNDSDPDGDALSAVLDTGPAHGTLLLNADGSFTYTPTIGYFGTDLFRYHASDGSLSSNVATVTITVVRAPPVLLRIDVTPANLTIDASTSTVQYTATGTFDYGGTQDLTARATWTSSDTTVAQIDATGLATRQCCWVGARTTTIGAAVGGIAGSTSLTVNYPPATPPTVSISAPADSAVLTTPTDVVGTVTGGAWTLSYRLSGTGSFTQFAAGPAPVSNATLGTFDTTVIPNGSYDIRLRATNGAGSAEATIVETVGGSAKLGQLRRSFTDIAVPTPGIALQVVRTYDSFDKRQGDFGFGWSLQAQDGLRAQQSRPAGANWQQTSSGGFIPNYCLSPTKSSQVSFALGDGRVYRFEASTSPQCQALVPIDAGTLTYTPIGPTNATLVPLDATSFLVNPSGIGPTQLLDSGTLAPIDPHSFQLTLGNGTVYVVNDSTGIVSVTDRNGNRLTASATALQHSDGKQLTLARDSSSRITSITDPAGSVTAYTYDGSGNLVTVIDPLGHTTTYTYDANHDLLSETDPVGTVRTYAYDAAGRLTSTTDGAGARTSYAFDVPTLTQTATDPDGGVRARRFGSNGQLAIATNPRGYQTSWAYDANGYLVKRTDALGFATNFTRDANGDVLSVTNPLGATTSYTYDAFGSVLSWTNPIGGTTTNSYDAHGNRTSRTDPLGRTTRYTYDATGSVLSVLQPDGGTESFTFDAFGNRSSRTDFGGAKTQYTYDLLNQLTGVTDANGATIRRAYDASGHLTQLVDPTGTTTYTYDGDGRQIHSSTAQGTVDYTYDGAGRLLSASVDGAIVRYTYDSAGKPISVTDPSGRVTTFTNDANGNRTGETSPAGVAGTFGYDALDRPTVLSFVAASPIASFTYTYDAAGRITSETALAGTKTYTYDPNGDVTSESSGVGSTTYTYNAAGERTQKTDAAGAAPYVYGANGQLLSAGSTSFTYDANGRRTARNGPAPLTYGWSALGLLTNVGGPSATATYQYNGLGDLVGQSGTTVLVDPLTGNVLKLGTTLFVRDMTGNVLESIANPTTSFYLADALGSTRALVDASGAVTDTVDYDLFGNVTGRTGTGMVPFLDRGLLYDQTSGIYLLGPRTYDPTVAVSLTQPTADDCVALGSCDSGGCCVRGGCCSGTEWPVTCAGADQCGSFDAPCFQAELRLGRCLR